MAGVPLKGGLSGRLAVLAVLCLLAAQCQSNDSQGEKAQVGNESEDVETFGPAAGVVEADGKGDSEPKRNLTSADIVGGLRPVQMGGPGFGGIPVMTDPGASPGNSSDPVAEPPQTGVNLIGGPGFGGIPIANGSAPVDLPPQTGDIMIGGPGFGGFPVMVNTPPVHPTHPPHDNINPNIAVLPGDNLFAGPGFGGVGIDIPVEHVDANVPPESLGSGGPGVTPPGAIGDGLPPPTTTRAPFVVSDCGTTDEFSCWGRCGMAPPSPCSCHPECLIYGTCCADFSLHCPDTRPFLSQPQLQLLNSSSACLEGNKQRVIMSCPDGASHLLMSECMKTQADSVADLVPMTDRMTGVHYRNGHCAVCNKNHKIQVLRPWSAHVGCKNPLTKPDSLFDTLVESSAQDASLKECTVEWFPPGSEHTPSCVPEASLRHVPQCASPELRQLCANGPLSPVSATSTDGDVYTYRNKDCLLCEQELLTSCSIPDGQGHRPKPGDFATQVTMDWDEEDSSWSLTVKDAAHSPPSSFSSASCPADSYGTPGMCDYTCNEGFAKPVYGSCQPSFVLRYSLFVKLKLPTTTLTGATLDPLEVSNIVMERLDSEMFDIMSASVAEPVSTRLWFESPSWHFTYMSKLILPVVITDEARSQIIGAFRELLMQEALKRGWNSTGICINLSENHRHSQLPCDDFTHVLFDKSQSEAAVQRLEALGVDSHQHGSQGSGGAETRSSSKSSLGKYVSVLTSCISVCGLTVRLVLQPLLSAKCPSIACRLHCALTFSLVLLYALWLVVGNLMADMLDDLPLCGAAGVASHWLLLSAGVWVCGAAVEVWRLSRKLGQVQSATKNGARLVFWHMCAWILPAAFVAPEIVLEELLPSSLMAPAYDQGLCFLSHQMGLLVFFAVPACLLAVVSLVLASMALRIVRKATDEQTAATMLEIRTTFALAAIFAVVALLAIPAAVVDDPLMEEIFVVAANAMGFFLSAATLLGRQLFPTSEKGKKLTRKCRSKFALHRLSDVADRARVSGLQTVNEKQVDEEVNANGDADLAENGEACTGDGE